MKLKRGYKQTEVGVIPEDWDVPNIESVVDEISMGPFGSDITVSNFVSSGVPVLSGANVAQERLTDSFANFVTPAKALSLKKAVARRGDIVVTHRGTIGQIAYIPSDSEFERYVISQSQFRVRFSGQVLPSWAVRYFHSENGSKRLLEGKGHTGVPAIAQPTRTFRSLFLPVPPLPEQSAIATALSDVDALLSGLDKLIAKKRDLRQAVMQQLLTGKTRLPGFGVNTGVKQTEVGRIPDDWDVRLLGTLATMVASGRSSTGSATGDYPVHGSTGIIGQTSSPEYEGDAILVARVGANAGRLNFVSGKYGVTDNTIMLRFGGSYNLPFFWRQLEAKRLNSLVFGSGQPLITGTQLKALALVVPPFSEQSAIAAVLSDIDTELVALEARRDKTKLLKQSMMQELLTGKTRLV
ncbi:restriction endonuclease subunit S [Paraburkholderia sp. UCT2]|uniref:restriction endonuclease subunit S n=1 Tax=Paraburkholderia sp. UCT2 TaxID=2615208 RepID=UPI001655AE8A|nr:restriction endonuclease subunit S [Paraburkholderia sp. UCT2]MBC8726800.1 restriction endonuclease subunit S [Paraburkholderia sp. UCT2]